VALTAGRAARWRIRTESRPELTPAGDRFPPVIPAADEDDAVKIANDTIYGLNASVFTSDVNRARQVGARLRSGTVGHNAMRTDFGVSFGGYKQSGIGREGLHEGLQYFLETKFMVLEGQPEGYENTEL
jgi:aldehyde dehydrogenase (NAD+)